MIWHKINPGTMQSDPDLSVTYVILKTLSIINRGVGSKGEFQVTTYEAFRLQDDGLFRLGNADSFNDAKKIADKHYGNGLP